MMASRPEATELVNKFLNVEFEYNKNLLPTASLEKAKQCALICVDEMKKKLVSIDVYLNARTYSEYLKEFTELNEIKQEIEKL